MNKIKFLAGAVPLTVIVVSCGPSTGGSKRLRYRMSSQTIDANKIEVGMTKEEVEKAVGECHNYAIIMGDGSMSYDMRK